MTCLLMLKVDLLENADQLLYTVLVDTETATQGMLL